MVPALKKMGTTDFMDAKKVKKKIGEIRSNLFFVLGNKTVIFLFFFKINLISESKVIKVTSWSSVNWLCANGYQQLNTQNFTDINSNSWNMNSKLQTVGKLSLVFEQSSIFSFYYIS